MTIASADLRFEVLGPVTVRHGGAPVEAGTSRRTGVLAVLLARAGRAVPVDVLVDAVWERDPPPSAGKNLQTYVHRLRRLLGDADRIVRDGPGYRLVVRPGELDADRFEALVREGRAAAPPVRAAATLRRALDLWRGDEPYCGAPGTMPIRAEAGRLAELRLTALAAWADAELACGRAAEIVPDLTRLTRVHPLREDLRATLIRALCECGRRADALAAFEDARRVLRAELGTEPGAELRRLHRDMRTIRPVPPVPHHGDRPRDAAHERAEGLQAAVSPMLVPLRVTSLAGTGFWARTTGRRAGDLLVARITAAPHRVVREAGGPGDPELLKVVLNRGARPVGVEQDDRRCSVPSGHFVACDTTRRYEIVVPDRCDVSVVGVPRGVLGTDPPDRATAVPLPGGRGIGSLVAACLTGPAGNLDGLPDPARRHLGDALASLVAAALTGTTGGRVESESGLADRITAYVLANLSDPALCAKTVADRHGVSVRYLHLLFRERDETFAAWVRRERLTRVRRDLRDPALAGTTAAAIAARWGIATPRTSAAR
ncbi:hypothetical protein BJF79_05400 [Actinomadura sp. CNU-125]|uniref:BTAD domain-containing putative transcriptional regulator n=1 Tax=Actinomadura sp. CNU-125 TaxID=1904961 RepID=UPI0009665A27|nr:BTAD domain-containing putative transcriptional regulator [Actinomadura sp. CNU-125]OLT38170.1 hypothetical protein BJF79_05400 [Actinomadura sp. CNU-125]